MPDLPSLIMVDNSQNAYLTVNIYISAIWQTQIYFNFENFSFVMHFTLEEKEVHFGSPDTIPFFYEQARFLSL